MEQGRPSWDVDRSGRRTDTLGALGSLRARADHVRCMSMTRLGLTRVVGVGRGVFEKGAFNGRFALGWGSDHHRRRHAVHPTRSRTEEQTASNHVLCLPNGFAGLEEEATFGVVKAGDGSGDLGGGEEKDEE